MIDDLTKANSQVNGDTNSFTTTRIQRVHETKIWYNSTPPPQQQLSESTETLEMLAHATTLTE